jgi:hypothetical protein
MANYEIIALNETTPQLVAPTSSDTGTCAGNIVVTLDITGQTINATGDTSAGDAAAMGYTSVLGAIITGQGSTYDVTLVNDADATVLGIPTGTTNVAIPTGDLTVSAGDVTQTPATGDGIYLNSATAAVSNLAFGVDASSTRIIQFNRTTGIWHFGRGTTKDTIATELFTIAGSGNCTIPAGDLTLTAGFINLGTALEVTIATGVITATQSHHTVDTEANAASDTLDTISGGTEGDILFIRTVNNARDVIVGHNTGNIILKGGASVTLGSTNDSMMVIYNGTSWNEVLNYT